MSSRADEQSNLIAFYKNRADDGTRKSINFEKMNQNLMEEKSQLERDYDSLNGKFSKKK